MSLWLPDTELLACLYLLKLIFLGLFTIVISWFHWLSLLILSLKFLFLNYKNNIGLYQKFREYHQVEKK